jgi:hypothetical protein
MRKVLTARAASAREVVQVGTVEARFEGLGSEVGEQSVSEWVATRPQQRTEAARIVETQDASGFEVDVDVVMRAQRRVPLDDAQAPRHAEMEDHRAGRRIENEIFRAASDLFDALAAQLARKSA